MRGTGNFLRPLRGDPLVVDVTVWIPKKVTDSEGNVIIDPEGTAVILHGWDIQPIPSTLPPSFSPAGSVEMPNVRRAFAPVEGLQYLERGRPLKNNDNNDRYRIGTIQDWKSHLEVYLEVAG